MSHRICAVLALVLAFSGADASEHGSLYRSWRDQTSLMSARLLAKVELQPGYWGPATPPTTGTAPNPSDPPVWHPPVTEDHELVVSVQFSGPAPLRPGEIESFGLVSSHTYGQSAIAVELQYAQSVWDYQGSRMVYIPVSHPAPGSAPQSVAFVLAPTGRHPIRPPNVMTGFRPGTRGPNDPLVLEFDDAGLADDGHSRTVYSFKVWRKRSLWPDKLIAAGDFHPADRAARQRIVIEKGGAYQHYSEFLKEGQTYEVSLSLSKFGHDYTTAPSDAARFGFQFHATQQGYSREAKREVNFLTLGK